MASNEWCRVKKPSDVFCLPPLYAVLDADVAARAGWTLLDLASACLSGGAHILQLRAKVASGAWLLDMASAIVVLAHAAEAIVIVNDRADAARLADADGVHVGQDDVPTAAARAIVGPDAVLGVSTHTTNQIDAAIRGPATYIAVGPVFQTDTKATGHDAVGIDRVRVAAARAAARGLPVVAIGGITLDRAVDAIDAGAASVAVISDLLASGDPERRVREYVRRLAERGKV